MIPEIDSLDPKKVDRVVLCSGKVYYDRWRSVARKAEDTAIVRIEQLYPFPEDDLAEVLAPYKNLGHRLVPGRADEPGRLVLQPGIHASKSSPRTRRASISSMPAAKAPLLRLAATPDAAEQQEKLLQDAFTVNAYALKKPNLAETHTMAIEIKAPTFPESVADGTVATWAQEAGRSSQARRTDRRHRDRQGGHRGSRRG